MSERQIESDYNDPEQLLSELGPIEDVQIVDYERYVFWLIITTPNNMYYVQTKNCDPFWYNPLSLEWQEHAAHGISKIKLFEEIFDTKE